MVSGWGESGIEHLKVLNKNSLVISSEGALIAIAPYA